MPGSHIDREQNVLQKKINQLLAIGLVGSGKVEDMTVQEVEDHIVLFKDEIEDLKSHIKDYENEIYLLEEELKRRRGYK